MSSWAVTTTRPSSSGQRQRQASQDSALTPRDSVPVAAIGAQRNQLAITPSGKLPCKPGSMTARVASKILSWTVVVPVLAAVLLGLTWGRSIGFLVEVLVAFALAGAVLAAVNHAEVVALRVGEPFGSLALGAAVTIIEVSLIVTLMISGGPGTASLARDTVFAAVMITCNGIVGIALL